MAEGEGFEPSKRVNVYTLSKRAPSATRPPLLEIGHSGPCQAAQTTRQMMEPQ